eukprot:2235033-Amphidinium_carterae.1
MDLPAFSLKVLLCSFGIGLDICAPCEKVIQLRLSTDFTAKCPQDTDVSNDTDPRQVKHVENIFECRTENVSAQPVSFFPPSV